MSLLHTTHTPQTQGNTGEINLVRLLGELIDHYLFIAIVTVIFTALACLYAITATPVYQANALIQIEQKQGNMLLNNISQMLPDRQPQTAPEMTLLQSRMILGQTVDDLNLQTRIQPEYMPVVGKAFAKLTGKKDGKVVITRFNFSIEGSETESVTLTVIDKHHYQIVGEGFELSGRTGERLHHNGFILEVADIAAAPGSRFTLSRVPRLQAISDLQEVFSVAEQGKDTGMLRLMATGKNPAQLKDILNNISNNFLAQNIARQAAQDAKSLDFLNVQLPKIRSELNAAEDKLNAYRQQKDSVDLNMEAKSALDQIVNVDNQLNELTFREAEVSQLYKKDHPTYRALMEKRETLQSEKSKLNKRISAMPSTQQEVLRLSRDVDSGRAVYLQLLNRQQELNVAKSSAIGNVRIIDDAVTLIKPVKPHKAIVVFVGFLLGGFISIACVLLKASMNQSIESPEELEELGVNVYACIPHSEWLRKHNAKDRRNATDILLALENPVEPAIETLRGLRTYLHFATMEAKNNVLMISGVSPGVGKTFVSSNLATVIAQTQKKVLFIDADMRKGYTHELLGMQDHPGLSDILSGQCTLEESLTHLPAVGFDYISRGRVPPNPAELLMHPRFKSLLEKVSPQYDLVIIDSPPTMVVTDASIIGQYVGTVLMVTRFEVNSVKQTLASIRRLEQNGVPVKGCILNGMKRKSNGYNDYSYNYSYKDN